MAAPSSPKRPKKQKSLHSFFSNKEKERRLVCKGSIHQADVDSGGSQCVCTALSFLCTTDIPKYPSDVDTLLLQGTELYNVIGSDRNGMTIHEVPSSICIGNKSYNLTCHDPRSGLVSQISDDAEALIFSVKSAMFGSVEEASTMILTIGNARGASPGASIALKRTANGFIAFDSHSRDDNGLCSPDGKAVVLKLPTISEVSKYVDELAGSISADINVPFEITAISITERQKDTRAHQTCGPPMSDTEVLHPDPAVSIPQGPEFVSRSDPASTSAVTQEPTSARQQDTTHAAPHAPASSHATESESMQQQESGSFDVESHDNQRSGYHDDESTRKDIAHFTSRQVPDAVKHYFIQNRQPNANFTFPSKIYKDKRRKDGQMKRYCCREWFEKFEFISYSESTDGLFCLACVLFPDTEHRRPKLLVKDPYRNWKDAVSDLKTHTCNEYHINSMAKLNAFVTTFSCPSKRIDANIESSNSERISKNREILKSIVKSIVFCGRQGISLRGHRDDDTTTSLIKGNFKALLQFRCESGDLTLKDHLENCAKNASYTSKVSQNDILDCIKYYIQKCIVSEINQQKIGPYFGFQCDEVTDNSNWEQLGIVLRYTVDNKPVERLLEFVELEKTTGEAICESIVKALTDAGLDVQLCRSQTMDGAGNMSGKQAGCAARFQSLSPKAQYHYCSSHDLNLALCKCCNIKEIHVMLDTLTQLGLFFKYSPKRSRRLEEAVTEANSTRPKSEQISKSKFHVFCETRWVEKQTTLRDFSSMYAPIVECLEAIGQLESGWDTKAVTDAYGLLKKITDSTFIVCFQTVLHMFGYVIGISSKLQGTSLDIIQAYEMVTHVKTSVSEARNTDYKDVYTKASTMAQKAGLDSLQMPRRCGRQTQRSNVPADNVEQYYERAVFLPFVDSMSQQLNLRFNTMTQQACLAFCLLPNNIASATQESMLALLDFYRDDMPQPDMFAQEVQLWKQTWRNTENKPSTIVETLTETSQHMYPNISKVLTLLLLTSVTSAGVERSNSSLKFIKNPHRSTMGQSRFNALMLLFIHRDIKLDIEEIVNIYARKYPRRMLLIDPLCE